MRRQCECRLNATSTRSRECTKTCEVPGMGPTVTTFLMFEGKAEEAMNFYVPLFRNSGVVDIKRFGPGEAGAEGSIMRAKFSLNGREFICFDSPVKHAFTFTPAISLFVDCETEKEVDSLFATLS